MPKNSMQTQSKDVWVFIEVQNNQVAPVSQELLGVGARLADTLGGALCAIALGESPSTLASTLFAVGSQKIYVVEDPALAQYTAESYSLVVADLIARHHPEILLFGATALGRDLAPRVAIQAGTGVTANCLQLDIDAHTGCLLQTRPAFSHNLMATITCPKHRPQIATVRQGVFEKQPSRSGASGELIVEPSILCQGDLQVEVVQLLHQPEPANDLTSSKIVVGGGLGVGGLEGFSLLHSLADRLGGAVGATRAAIDAGWIEEEYQIGQTGKMISPDLYIACGISGEVQHVAGIQRAKRIIAINKNQNAPIFSVADYGLIGDCQEVIPALLLELEKQR